MKKPECFSEKPGPSDLPQSRLHSVRDAVCAPRVKREFKLKAEDLAGSHRNLFMN